MYSPEYTNLLGMNEYQEDRFILDKIEDFCREVLKTQGISKKNSDLFDFVYEYIQDNLEKFIPEADYE